MNTLRHPRNTIGCRARRGATAVEFAIAASILFLLMFAAVEFARMNILRHSADNAAYEAARFAMVPGGTAAEAEQRAHQMLSLNNITNATVTVSPNPILENSPLITVDVDLPVDGNTWGSSMFGRGRRVAASATLHTERPPVIQAQALPTRPTPPRPPTPPPTTPPVVTPPPTTGPPSTPRPPRPPAPPRPRR